MQIVQGLPVLPARPAAYDRLTADRILLYVAGAIAPHGFTVRASRTVPAATLIQIAALHLGISDSAAQITPGLAIAVLNVTDLVPVTGSIARVSLLPSAVGQVVDVNFTPGLVLPATRVISIATSDSSNGGTLDYNLAAALTEFSA